MTYDAAPDPSARQGRKTVNESQDTPLSEGSWQPFLTVNACGRDWTLERAADMEALWESMTEFTEDERLPYWTELWPSSLVLADWLYQRRESLRGQLDGSIPATEEGQATQPDALVGAESLSMSDMGSQGGGQNDGGRGQGGFAGNGEGPGVEAQKRPAQQAPAT